jgi:hypothetical protein
MSRVAALILLVVAPPAFAQKAALYKTPQECFEAGSRAFAKGDHKTWVGCLAPESQKQLAAEFGVQFALERAAVAELKDKDQAAAAAKAFAPLFAVLDKHGLTAKATKAVTKGKDKKEREAARKIVLDAVKDPQAFLVDFFEAMEKLDNLTKEKDNASEKLTGVEIDGDTASATIERTVKGKDKPSKEKATFVKVGGGWRLVRHFSPDAPKK